MGLAALPWYVAHASVSDGTVRTVLADWALPSQEIHAVFPSPKLVPAKVTGLIKWLQGQFGQSWWTRTFSSDRHAPSPASGRGR
jgi:DNA-binding transcriptional LysR family regulator